MTYLLLFPALLPIITALIMMCKFKVSPGRSMLSALILTAVFAAFIWKMNLQEITAAGTLGGRNQTPQDSRRTTIKISSATDGPKLFDYGAITPSDFSSSLPSLV